MQERHLVISSGPELENNATRSVPNSAISRCFGKYGKRWQRRKTFRIWSGLSESNRHLNLGKSTGDGVSTGSKITAPVLDWSAEYLVVRSESRVLGVAGSFSQCAFALILTCGASYIDDRLFSPGRPNP